MKQQLLAPFLFVSLAVSGLSGCSGASADADSTGDGDGDGDGDGALPYPPDASQASIEAFLDAESYKQDPWIGDPAVRVIEGTSSYPHGNALRVYFNPLAVDAVTNDTTAVMGAMAVKEFYDETGALVGKAVNFHSGEGTTRDDITFYCQALEGETFCTGAAYTGEPVYGPAFSECGACHGTTGFLAPLPGGG